VRCSSCEPLLDDYLEATLRPRQALAVGEHLRDCAHCAAFLHELRVIDGLLTTARAGNVAADFTAGVVTATRATQPPSRKALPLWLPLLAYLAIAWAFAAAALRVSQLGAILRATLLSEQRGLAAVEAALRAVAPATPMVAAAVTGVLLLDLLLLGAVFYGYRHLRPLIALYLTKDSNR
jgi:anti-sigma factor RsiW